MCLSRGYIVKLAKRTPDKKFRTCFPPKTTTCNIRRESILNLFSNNFKYYIYSELFEQERGISLNTVSGLPEEYIMKLPQSSKDYILRCIQEKQETFQFNYKKNSKKDSKKHHDKKRHNKKGNKSYGRKF